MKKNYISVEELDKKFDDGEEGILQYFDLEKAERLGDNKPKRVSVDFPAWMVNQLDDVSKKLGVTRQSVIKFFIADRLKQEKAEEM
ncbi:type II toxin-antitoxin system BrnA family antitoxin [Ekhidna sp.]|uniref:type II toxin-antitoxin system BrnA family antitoxin n=1 Tax=Ekhidna sp. TaxID=2608089 RepID=UPI003CCBE1ED